ncbi:CPBP family intramembrane glutamic endopeptidase [Natronomonas salsuginis]|jgi:membrane protease YdiL (CAAX protease family)|uniref:CPBP family intramembrane metalloprotease n=1 Tax=Natronomonas salsuginis TaxID=2217661 RepID=A0A4U5J9Z5_9EURY|nr:type II CAAX endopeptidase family protein [Natronomonas salsuginis]TKR25970.1 CPBP family intramembrane metalloprotease [Natronomonas salsuginis]
MSAGGGRTVLEAIALTVLAFLVAVVAGIVFLVPTIALGYDVDSTPVLIGATAAGQLGFFAVGYGYVRLRNVAVPLAVPTRPDLRYVSGGTALALGVAIGLSYVLSLLGLVPGSVIEDVGVRDPTFFLALAVLSVILVAPVEELLFRGVIQGRLRGRFGPRSAIAGSSLLFGAMHLSNYTGSVPPIVAGASLIAVIGAVFGALYERTGNLAVPILVHAIYNVVLLAISYLAVVYG